MRVLLIVVTALLPLACGTTEPTPQEVTGYLLTVTGGRCIGGLGEPYQIVVVRRPNEGDSMVFSRPTSFDEWQFTLEIRMRNRNRDLVAGDALGGGVTASPRERLLFFGAVNFSAPPTVRVPFVGAGQAGGEFAAVMNGRVIGNRGLRGSLLVCDASDHHLHFQPVFGRFDL